MRAASRALAVLLAVVASGAPADAQAPAPQCPPVVAELPLSVSTPFSGTPHPVADADGEVTSTSLLCAYGEGVEPSAEVLLTWASGASCGTTGTEVAPGLDPAPFDALADDLAAAVGGTCPPAEGAALPVVPVAAGGAAVLLLAVAARRRRTPTRSGTRSPSPVAGIECQNEEAEVEAVPGPDLSLVLAELSTAHGRALARTEQGQWLVVAALARDVDMVDVADARPGRRPARPELAELAEGLAHQAAGADR